MAAKEAYFLRCSALVVPLFHTLGTEWELYTMCRPSTSFSHYHHEFYLTPDQSEVWPHSTEFKIYPITLLYEFDDLKNFTLIQHAWISLLAFETRQYKLVELPLKPLLNRVSQFALYRQNICWEIFITSNITPFTGYCSPWGIGGQIQSVPNSSLERVITSGSNLSRSRYYSIITKDTLYPALIPCWFSWGRSKSHSFSNGSW